MQDISGLAAHVLPADVLTPAPCSVAMEKEGRDDRSYQYIIRHESLSGHAQRHSSWSVADMPSDPHLEGQTSILASQPAFSC